MKPLHIPVCPAPGNCPGFYLPSNLPADHPQANQFIPCACTLAQRAATLQAQLPSIVREMTFDTFRETSENKLALAFACRFAKNPWEQDQRLLMFIGPNRKGKTHLAAAIVNALLACGEPAHFENVPELMDRLRAGCADQADENLDQRLVRVKNASVLILDDLGAEAGQAASFAVTWTQDKLYQIIDHRLMWELPTVVTSNLKPEILPARIGSRLRDEHHATVVAIISPNGSRR